MQVARATQADRERPGGDEGAEAAVVFAVALSTAALSVGVAVEAGTMQCGVECGFGDVGQGPGGAVASKGAFHGPAIAEEKDVSGLEQDRVHAWVALLVLWFRIQQQCDGQRRRFGRGR